MRCLIKDVPAFVSRLRASSSLSTIALEFLILTACRTSEVRLAVWDEIDLENRVWTIPKERMKAGREHRVPLSDRCIEILDDLSDQRRIFPIYRSCHPVSHWVMGRLHTGEL